MDVDDWAERIKTVLRAIPFGTVMSYGEVGEAAGLQRGARQVVWVLRTSSENDHLPWQRVVRKDRRIAIKNPDGAMLQRRMLESEGWSLKPNGLLVRDEMEK